MYPQNPNGQPPVPPGQPQPNQGWGPAPVPQSPQQPGYQPYPQQNPIPPTPPQPLMPPPRPPKKTSHGPLSLLFNDWMKEHWKLVLLIAGGLIVLGLVIYQIVYPSSRLLPGATVDDVQLGGLRKSEAAAKLNELYGSVQLNIFFGKNTAAFLEPKIKDVGINVLNEDRIEAMEYPFYLRLIPGSIFWANSTMKAGDLKYSYDREKIQSYTQSKVGDSCTIPARDATLKLVDSQLQVVPSVPGAVCDITRFQQQLAEVRPTADSDNDVRIDSTETPAKVDDEKARQLASVLNARLKDPMPIVLNNDTESVPGRVVLSWLDFKSDLPPDTPDNTTNQTAKIVFAVNKDRMISYLNAGIAAKVIKKPGVSKVSTLDFKETSRVNGANGTELDVDKILVSVTDYINSKNNQAVAVTRVVGPSTVYTRTYTPTSVGYSALLAQFAQDNPGTYGLVINELSGVRNLRSASYNADARFVSAGIESVFLSYVMVMDKYDGSLRPAEKISGSRNVETCFKDMIIKQDEACRLGFYSRFGFAHTTARGAELGLKNTVFADKGGVTSANDLQKLIIGLYKNQIARVEGGQQILSTGRTIRSNEGIPAGVTSGDVSHFVGENEKAHNDSAIVYSSKGVYALTVLSDGSSWEKVAALAKKIEAFKQMKVPTDAR